MRKAFGRLSFRKPGKKVCRKLNSLYHIRHSALFLVARRPDFVAVSRNAFRRTLRKTLCRYFQALIHGCVSDRGAFPGRIRRTASLSYEEVFIPFIAYICGCSRDDRANAFTERDAADRRRRRQDFHQFDPVGCDRYRFGREGDPRSQTGRFRGL